MRGRSCTNLWLAAACVLCWTTSIARGQVRVQLEQQLEQVRTASAQNPDDYNVLVELASTLHQLDHLHPDGGSRVPEAEEAYRRAIKVSPNAALVAPLQGNLGALLMSAGRMQDALEVIQESLEASRAAGQAGTELYAGALYNKGKALGMMGREIEAQDVYQEAMSAARGTTASTWTKACASLKSFTQEQIDDMEAAATFLSMAAGIDIKDESGQALSRSQRRRQREAAAILEEWAWLEGTTPVDHSWLHFALYAAHQKQGNKEAAWDHLVKGNRLQKEALGKVAQQDEMLLQAMKSAFHVPKSGAAAGPYEALLGGMAGFQDPTPVFVVGMARSGSTLIEQILASHPQVHGAGEDTALAPLIPRLLTVLEGQGGGVDIRAVAAVGETYVKEMRARVPGGAQPSRIVDKMLRNSWNLGHIAFMLPKAQIIWAVRHPMDVALSCFAQPFEGRGTPWAWDLEDIARQIDVTHQIMQHWKQVLPGRVLELPYEELVADQEAASRRLLQHCGLPWDPVVLDFQATSRTVQTASLAQVRQRIYKSAVGKWREYEEHLQPAYDFLKPLVTAYEEQLKHIFRPAGGPDEL